MPHLFPPGLIACIRDGRSPRPEEVISLSRKLWDEGLAFRSPAQPELAQPLARVAFGGCIPNSKTSRTENAQTSRLSATAG